VKRRPVRVRGAAFGGRPGGRKLGRRARIVQFVCLAIAFFLGILVLGKRVGAQQPTGPRAGGPPSAGMAAASGEVPPAPAPKPKPKPKPKDAGADAAKEAGVDEKDGGADGGESCQATDAGPPDPICYAVVQTDDDFPKDMTDEQKAAIGTGKVPIHREGAFKSPFAHPRFGGPTKVKVGLVIREIREFNIQTGGFEADFFLSLTGDKELPNIGKDTLVFTNGHEVTFTVLADTPTFKLFNVTGKFTTDIDLRRYPFDEQALDLAMEDSKAGVDQLLFEPDQARTSLDSSFRLAGFSPAGVGAIAYKHKYPPRFDRDDLYVSRYRFTLTMARFATSAAFSVYVPALIIVLISLTGMWVPPEELEVRSNAGAPMLAAAVLFHYSLIQALPATGYLTSADKLMLGVYVSLLINMLSTWGLLLGDEDWARRVFRLARTVVPIVTVVVMLVSIFA
jgi:hypothetical protein